MSTLIKYDFEFLQHKNEVSLKLTKSTESKIFQNPNFIVAKSYSTFNNLIKPKCYKCQLKGIACPDDDWRKFCPLPLSGIEKDVFYQCSVNLPVEHLIETEKVQSNMNCSTSCTNVDGIKNFDGGYKFKALKCQSNFFSTCQNTNQIKMNTFNESQSDILSKKYNMKIQKTANENEVLYASNNCLTSFNSPSTINTKQPSSYYLDPSMCCLEQPIIHFVSASSKSVSTSVNTFVYSKSTCSNEKPETLSTVKSFHAFNDPVDFDTFTGHHKVSGLKNPFTAANFIKIAKNSDVNDQAFRKKCQSHNNSSSSSFFIQKPSFIKPKLHSKGCGNYLSPMTKSKSKCTLTASNIDNLQAEDLIGNIMKISSNQIGSRKIQSLIMKNNEKDLDIIFKEVMTFPLELMTNSFGNYVIQKLYDHCGWYHQTRRLDDVVKSNIIHLALNEYGCRVVQAAFRNMKKNDNEIKIFDVLDSLENSVFDCIQDKNGNHVIKLAMEFAPSYSESVINSVKGHCISLSQSINSYTILQVLFDTVPNQCDIIFHELFQKPDILVSSPLANFVAQSIVSNGKKEHKNVLINWIIDNLHSLCHQQHASNVVEMCICYSSLEQKQQMVKKICEQATGSKSSYLEQIVDNHYGNYVVQTMLEDEISRNYMNFTGMVKQIIDKKLLRGEITMYLKGILSKLTKLNKSSY